MHGRDRESCAPRTQLGVLGNLIRHYKIKNQNQNQNILSYNHFATKPNKASNLLIITENENKIRKLKKK